MLKLNILNVSNRTVNATIERPVYIKEKGLSGLPS